VRLFCLYFNRVLMWFCPKRLLDASMMPPPADPSVRNRIVEVLAHTANGCLAELGYFPGMLPRLQQLEELASKWQQENIQLYEDNGKLVTRNRQLEEMAAHDPQDPTRTELIRRLQHETQMLSVTNHQQTLQLHKLNAEYNKVLESKTKLVHENKQLVAFYRSIRLMITEGKPIHDMQSFLAGFQSSISQQQVRPASSASDGAVPPQHQGLPRWLYLFLFPDYSS
jgi:hypothetical protein